MLKVYTLHEMFDHYSGEELQGIFSSYEVAYAWWHSQRPKGNNTWISDFWQRGDTEWQAEADGITYYIREEIVDERLAADIDN